ncbi:MAG: toxin-antitoxin system HicB family antitoxin [Thermaerobacter sp.]|nr:toxin-antitoxin system HicB family antitoxin [Thermaerobacter sp.]
MGTPAPGGGPRRLLPLLPAPGRRLRAAPSRAALPRRLRHPPEGDEEIPEPGRNRYSGRFVLRLPRSLHRQLAVLAAHEGIGLNRYIPYRLSRNVPEPSCEACGGAAPRAARLRQPDPAAVF